MRTGRGRFGGFTLIELLLVLTIIALVLGLAPSLLHKAFPVLKLKAAARDLVQEIRYVQNAAIINNSPAGIRFDLASGEYRSDQVNAGQVRTLPSGLALSLGHAQAFVPQAHKQVSFLFYPDGSSSGGVIYLSNDRQRLRISVDWLTSKVRVNESDASI
jgi:general secretion pathway protein H